MRDEAARREFLEADQGQQKLCWTEADGGVSGPDATIVSGECDPWHLLSGASDVVTDGDDSLALLAAVAGLPVRCVSAGPFEEVVAGPEGQASRREALRLTSIESVLYRDPFSGERIDIAQAVELCAFWRRLVDSNRHIAAGAGFAAWKRTTVRPLLWPGSSGLPLPSSMSGIDDGASVAVWRSRLSRSEDAELARKNARLVEVEDGFIRSVGLGADCVPPLSITVDALGAHFDPRQPSELERLLQDGEFSSHILDRASALRDLIIRHGISKYGSGQEPLPRRSTDQRHVLVPGQVEDDRSVLTGGGPVTTNLELLRRVRADRPNAYILYKPHPDVEAGHRIGAIPDEQCRAVADEIVRDASISPLIDMVDEVQVNTSLAGFEALLRGKPVTTHGVPFYAGWGLTRDLGAIPERRTARRTLDELVAATLLLYPRYLDPETGLPCPPEILIQRLAQRRTQAGGLVRLRRLQGRLKRQWDRMKERVSR